MCNTVCLLLTVALFASGTDKTMCLGLQQMSMSIINLFAEYFVDPSMNRLVYKMSQNSEKCPSQTQNDVFKCIFLSKSQ